MRLGCRHALLLGWCGSRLFPFEWFGHLCVQLLRVGLQQHIQQQVGWRPGERARHAHRHASIHRCALHHIAPCMRHVHALRTDPLLMAALVFIPLDKWELGKGGAWRWCLRPESSLHTVRPYDEGISVCARGRRLQRVPAACVGSESGDSGHRNLEEVYSGISVVCRHGYRMIGRFQSWLRVPIGILCSLCVGRLRGRCWLLCARLCALAVGKPSYGVPAALARSLFGSGHARLSCRAWGENRCSRRRSSVGTLVHQRFLRNYGLWGALRGRVVCLRLLVVGAYGVAIRCRWSKPRWCSVIMYTFRAHMSSASLLHCSHFCTVRLGAGRPAWSCRHAGHDT